MPATPDRGPCAQRLRRRALTRRANAVLFAAVAVGTVWGAGSPAASDDEATAGASIAWVSDPELDLIGWLAADVPWRLSPRTIAYLALDTQTAIEGSGGELTFDVRELDYDLDLGIRTRLASGLRLSVFGGQKGKERVDDLGRSSVRYVGLGLEADAAPGLSWRAAAGPVVGRRNVDADAWLRAEVHLRPPGRPRLALALDLELDALVRGGHVAADLRAGPSAWWSPSASRHVSLFAHYLRARNPLGVGRSGILLGFGFEERPGIPGDRLSPPDVGGVVAAAGGDGRGAARLKLDLSFPRLPANGWLAADFDLNVLTGAGTDELYYLYHLGYERAAHGRIVGAYFYHRSNHRLSQPGEVTSINVVQAGVESAHWNGVFADLARNRWGRFDARVRLGYLATSSFGEHRRWHALGAARWLSPRNWGGLCPFVVVEIEQGDVGRRTASAGLAARSGFAVAFEYRRDEQFFGRDRTALLLTGERRF